MVLNLVYSENKLEVPSWLRTISPFIIGGLSGSMATCIIQPIDMIKVRLQLEASKGNKSTVRETFRHIIKNDSVKGLYKGLDAAIIRQVVYTTTRLGIFRISSDALSEKMGVEVLPFSYKVIIGLYSGAIGAFLGNPADLSLIRLQSDSAAPLSKRKNYSGIFNTVFRIVREEGFFSLYKGSMPTIIRAMTANTGMLSTFDHSKEFFSKYTTSKTLNSCLSSCIGGFFAATASLPFDYIKTCMQKTMLQTGVNSATEYKGFLDCIIKNYKHGGIWRFYSSYGPYYIRVAPHATLTLLFSDLFHTLFKNNTIIRTG